MKQTEAKLLSTSRILGDACHEAAVGREVFDDVRDSLEQLVESLNREATLHPAGRLRAENFLKHCLRQRLELRASRSSYPASFKRELRRPIFIVGLPGSGSTLLHQLMCLDEENRTPRMWELAFPTPPPDTASYSSNPRIGLVRHELQVMNAAQPETHRTRLPDAEEPGDCSAIFSRCLMSPQTLMHYAIPDYARWFWKQPLGERYRWYREELQLLQTNVLGNWVLRSPFHQWGVAELHAVFPDAVLVQTHRELLELLAAGASRIESLRKAHSDAVDPLACGRDAGEMAYRYTRCFGEWREQHGATVIDVSYRDLIAKPLDTLASVYRATGRKLGMQARMRVQAWLRENPHYAPGKRGLDGVRYGLDAAAVLHEMADYTGRYGQFL